MCTVLFYRISKFKPCLPINNWDYAPTEREREIEREGERGIDRESPRETERQKEKPKIVLLVIADPFTAAVDVVSVKTSSNL